MEQRWPVVMEYKRPVSPKALDTDMKCERAGLANRTMDVGNAERRAFSRSKFLRNDFSGKIM